MSPPDLETTKRKLRAAADEAAEMYRGLERVVEDLTAAASLCAEALRGGHRLLFCGNGGSAAESQHLATEFVVRLSSQRERGALAAIALTTDTSLLTACANDYGFDRVFARQVEAHAQPEDVLILLSTSGRSPNLIAAAQAARKKSVRTLALVGKDSTPLDALVDRAVHMPSSSSQRVQEGHLFCGHLLVEMVEDLLAGSAQ
jgi:D-sedoheptulose 7-phosphate isomerase